ncbi:MAG: ribosome maturation factor RimM [Acidimicrobiia bacterium]|nr:ribosome maturation factor RimM [Acidimicrobiia bacterium]
MEARGDTTRISVGYVRRAHGIKGDVIVRPLTDHPGRYQAGASLQSDEDPPHHYTIRSSQPHNDGLLVRFQGIENREAAEALQGVTFTIGPEERRTLGEDEYWPDDLEGLVAIDRDGVHLGVVSGVILGEAQDRLVVATEDGREIEVPFVSELVGEIHPSMAHVVIDPPEGLF